MPLQKCSIVFQCDSVNSFSWQSQLRYYWDPTLDECMVKMTNSKEVLGYEYQGVEPRLVITPLTVCLLLYKSKVTIILVAALDFRQFDILTCVDSDEPLQPHFKLRNSKWSSVSSLTIIKYSSY